MEHIKFNYDDVVSKLETERAGYLTQVNNSLDGTGIYQYHQEQADELLERIQVYSRVSNIFYEYFYKDSLPKSFYKRRLKEAIQIIEDYLNKFRPIPSDEDLARLLEYSKRKYTSINNFDEPIDIDFGELLNNLETLNGNKDVNKEDLHKELIIVGNFYRLSQDRLSELPNDTVDNIHARNDIMTRLVLRINNIRLLLANGYLYEKFITKQELENCLKYYEKVYERKTGLSLSDNKLNLEELVTVLNNQLQRGLAFQFERLSYRLKEINANDVEKREVILNKVLEILTKTYTSSVSSLASLDIIEKYILEVKIELLAINNTKGIVNTR